MSFVEKYGPWAVITGASSGIGAEFARQLAAARLHVVLVARRRDRLDELANQLSAEHGVQTRVVVADLSTENFLDTLLPAIQDLDVGLLVNNAGFTTFGSFVDCSLESQLQMVHVNCRAPMLLAHSFGNRFKQRGRGGMIVTSSLMGFVSTAHWSQYNATKGYDLLLAEALAIELKPFGVDVQALCPGGTRTEFLEASGGSEKGMGFMAKFLIMNVQDVVRTSLKRLGRSRTVVPGLMNKLNAFSVRWMPRWLASRMFGNFVKMLDAHTK